MEIDIKEFKLLCEKGSESYNEDMVGICKKGAWVLDGATGLNNKNLISKESDAKWYVSWWNKYLEENISKNTSLKNSLVVTAVAQALNSSTREAEAGGFLSSRPAWSTK